MFPKCILTQRVFSLMELALNHDFFKEYNETIVNTDVLKILYITQMLKCSTE